MSAVAVTNDFVSGTTIESAKVDQNFSDLVSYINSNCIVKDGSLASTAVLSGPATDPSSANHYTRKQYVDDNVGRASSSTTGSHTFTASDAWQSLLSLTITNPGKAVVVEAWGSALHLAGGGTTVSYKARVGISLDNGATYTYSTTDQAHIAAGLTNTHAPFFRKAGTPTGNIKVVLEHWQSLGASTFGAATEASLLYDMFKTVAV